MAQPTPLKKRIADAYPKTTLQSRLSGPTMTTMSKKDIYKGGEPTYRFVPKVQPSDATKMPLNPNAARVKSGAKPYVAPKPDLRMDSIRRKRVDDAMMSTMPRGLKR